MGFFRRTRDIIHIFRIKNQMNLLWRAIPLHAMAILPLVLNTICLWLIRQREILLVDTFPLVKICMEVNLRCLNRRVAEVLLDNTKVF